MSEEMKLLKAKQQTNKHKNSKVAVIFGGVG